MKKPARNWAYRQLNKLSNPDRKKTSWLYTACLVAGIILYIYLATR